MATFLPVGTINFVQTRKAWAGGGVPAMQVQVIVDGAFAKLHLVANVSRGTSFTNRTGAPNPEHGFNWVLPAEYVKMLASPGLHRLM